MAGITESVRVEFPHGDLYLSPGMLMDAWCDDCEEECATEVDLWGFFDSMMSDGPLLTLWSCAQCDDGSSDIAEDIRRAWFEQVEGLFHEDDES